MKLHNMVQGFVGGGQEALAALEQMSEQRSDIYGHLAAHWLQGWSPFEGWGDDEEKPSYGFSAEEWQRLLADCRKATRSVDCNTTLETLDRYAIVGHWPKKIPTGIRERDVTDPFLDIGFVAAWMRAWTKEERAFSDFVHGREPIWRPACHHSGFSVAVGLLEALRRGLLAVPKESRLRFLVAYHRWYANTGVGNANTEQVFWALYRGEDPAALPEQELQVLAACSCGQGGFQLGTKRVPLVLPEIQDTRSWINGYAKTVAVPAAGTVEEAAAIFPTSHKVEKLLLTLAWQGTEVPADPTDPFGEKVDQFRHLVGLPAKHDGQNWWPSEVSPRYEDYLDHLRSR